MIASSIAVNSNLLKTIVTIPTNEFIPSLFLLWKLSTDKHAATFVGQMYMSTSKQCNGSFVLIFPYNGLLGDAIMTLGRDIESNEEDFRTE